MRTEAADHLLRMIDGLLAGGTSFDQFERDYYRYYIDEVSEGLLSDEQRELFGEAQLKLDFTAVAPHEDERREGWMDREEYLHWLREARAVYRKRFLQ